MTKASFLDSLSPRLTGVETMRLVPNQSASVAVIFRELDRGEEAVLLIRRAERKGDPWSGQTAFPGGRVSAGDESFEATARREALEEVGVDLSSGGDFLGYMRELRPRMRDIVVVPSVFKLESDSKVTPNREVASYEWVTLNSLARKKARSTYFLRRNGEEVAFPSLVHGDLVIWGLTERILSGILRGQTEDADDGVLGKVDRY
jgi:8-oxo-dGTP pyrophosphatase MutT (NUDIX family)